MTANANDQSNSPRSSSRRVIFNLPNVRRLLISVAVLVTLVGLFYTFENWRGQRAWQSFVADMKARGEPLTIEELLPPPVPDEENFAMIPLLRPLLDYQHKPGETNVWRDEEAYNRLTNLRILPRHPEKAWSDRHTGRLTDFAAWQSALRTHADYRLPEEQLSEMIVVTNDLASGMTERRYDTNHAVREVLLALRKFDPEMKALHASVDLPHLVFPVHYEEGFAALLSHWQVFRRLGEVARLKASAALAQGRTADALKEFRLIVRMSEAADAEPLLISQLVRIVMLGAAAEIAWEGMATAKWSDDELRAVEERLRGVDMVKLYVDSMRGEWTLAMHGLELVRDDPYSLGDIDPKLLKWGPSGWYEHNLATFGRMFDEFVLPLAAPDEGRLFLDEGAVMAQEMDRQLRDFNRYQIFARLLLPAYEKVLKRFARCQVAVDQLRLACGIERFRMRHDRLPRDLNEVAALMGMAPPKDPTNGEDYRYRADAESGEYVIWSPAGDGVDDGGVQAEKPARRMYGEEEKGDWAWKGQRVLPAG